MTKLTFPDGFLWGGAVSAHQLEGGWNKGGKGLSVADIMTAGANGVPREITDGIIEGEIILILRLLIFTANIKKISLYLQKWALNVLEPASHGHVFSLMEMKANRMNRDCNFMMTCLMNC